MGVAGGEMEGSIKNVRTPFNNISESETLAPSPNLYNSSVAGWGGRDWDNGTGGRRQRLLSLSYIRLKIVFY